MQCFLVPHTHWDREWYRTHQAFRARLVDTVDSVMKLLEEDRDYVFLLDGQSVILEDYLEIRPSMRPALEAAARSGRIAIGPWYVQPDSFMPAGESHVRNLLEGRRVGSEIGRVSDVGYTPDSFGHPAQYPQILRGFGLRTFVHWRGNGNEADELPNEYIWAAPDGSEVVACLMRRGYGNAASLPEDVTKAVDRLQPVIEDLAKAARNDRILLMNGSDHLLPDPHTREVVEALSEETGHKVVRSLLEDFVSGVVPEWSNLPRFSGELKGARLANLLPGVWSTRTWIKLRNRRCETLLFGWAEPWAAVGKALGLPDERPSLRLARRALLHNQAHDSICGCSKDEVHEQMRSRFDHSEELAVETTVRLLERLAGLGMERRAPWSEAQDLAVFNPSPHPRTDVVRLALDAYPPSGWRGSREMFHPLLWRNMNPKGFTVDGVPARLVAAEKPGRVRLRPDQEDWEIEFVASDIPAFGWKSVRLEPAEETPELIDNGREISAGEVGVRVEEDGRLSVSLRDLTFSGLCGLEDTGDRGDTYDFDAVPNRPGDPRVSQVAVERARHASGIQELMITRVLELPIALAEDRETRSRETIPSRVVTRARVAPGVGRVDLIIQVDNTASDHRLRMLFPTGSPAGKFLAATTFDVAERSTGVPKANDWAQPPQPTFPHQGWVTANDLTIVAPGLPEAEVTSDGVIAVTLLRSVGWLSRFDLRSRRGPAGWSLPTPRAQCLGEMEAAVSIMRGGDPRQAIDAELSVRAVIAGADAALQPDRSVIELEPRSLVLSSVKPAEDGGGTVVRLYNPTDEAVTARLTFSLPFRSVSMVRLDETPDEKLGAASVQESTATFEVPARAIRTLLFE